MTIIMKKVKVWQHFRLMQGRTLPLTLFYDPAGRTSANLRFSFSSFKPHLNPYTYLISTLSTLSSLDFILSYKNNIITMVLKGISPLISPTLLKILAEMGHGDEIVLADAHFPSHSVCPPHIPVVRADGMYTPSNLMATDSHPQVYPRPPSSQPSFLSSS